MLFSKCNLHKLAFVQVVPMKMKGDILLAARFTNSGYTNSEQFCHVSYELIPSG